MLQERPWDGDLEFPRDAHWAASGMVAVPQWPKIREGIRWGRSHEKQEAPTIKLLLNVALPGWRVWARTTLRLPVKQPFANGVILVPSRRGESLVGFVESDEHDFGFRIGQSNHA